MGQGAHLGPLLYLVFFNDIGTVMFFCKFLLFADDLKLNKTICSVNDNTVLKADLFNIIEWLRASSFSVNVGKCFFPIYSRRSADPVEYNINGVSLIKKDCVEDLGVIFDQRLSFKAHIDYVTDKAQRKLYFVLCQSKAFKNAQTLLNVNPF